MKTSQAPNQDGTYIAHEVANQLRDALESDDDGNEVLVEFHSEMSEYQQDSFAHLQVVGYGVLHEAFVWWMADHSILLMGWESEEELVVGVLPPESCFTPAAYNDGKFLTLH